MAKDISTEASKLAQNWSFNWPVMDVMIGGKSAIDLPALSVFSPAEADEFVKNYGFDMSDPKDRRRVQALLIECWSFIESTLMPTEWKSGIRPPEHVLSCSDPRQLLLWASSTSEEDTLQRAWACAVLRAAHTAAHIDGVWAIVDADVAANQIRARFDRFIHTDSNGTIWFGDDRDRVELEHIEWKAPKSRRSVFLKLLHKPGNVAETIFDLLGVRIVTKTLADTLLAVKYLRDFHIISFANNNPGRVRNTLIDFEAFAEVLEKSRKDLLEGEIDAGEFLNLLDRADDEFRKKIVRKVNPHSATKYQSLQMTARQLITTCNPGMEWANRLDEYVSSGKGKDNTQLKQILNFIENWPGFADQRQLTSFFPFEVQILDTKAFSAIKRGEASHEKYKMSQVRTARRRILGEVFTLVRDELKSDKVVL